MTFTPKAIAVYLANREADYRAARSPKASAVAKARLNGATEMAHLLGWGMTPADVYFAVMDWVRANPRPDDGGTAWPVKFKAWACQAENDLTRLLEEKKQ
jgi:hypothetical protein